MEVHVRSFFVRVGEILVRRIRRAREGGMAFKLIRQLQTIGPLRTFWHKNIRRPASDFLQKPSPVPEDWAADISQTPDGCVDDALIDELGKRIRHSCPRYDPNPNCLVLVNTGLAAGGAERQIMYLLSALAEHPQIQPIFLGEHLDQHESLNFYRPRIEQLNIPVKPVSDTARLNDKLFDGIPYSVAEALSKLPQYLMLDIINLVHEFRKLKPYAVHLWQDSASIKGGIAALIAGCPHIILSGRNISPENFDYHQDYHRPCYKILSSFEQVVFSNNSQAGANDYAAWLGLPQNKIHVVRNGISIEAPRHSDGDIFRQQHGLNSDAEILSGIFRFSTEKQPMLWLDVAAALVTKRPSIHFAIAGDGPMRAEIKTRIKALGLHDKITLLGEIDDIAGLLCASNAFLLTSQFEGTPNAALEAQWFGVPTILTDAGGTSEAILDGVTGRLVPTGNLTAIVTAVEGMLDQPPPRRNGSAFVTEQFSVGQMVEQTLLLYQFPS